jgi:hypothetical protein
MLRPVILRRRQEAPAADVERAVRNYGHRSLSALAAQQDKHLLTVASGRGLVAYAVRGPVAFAAGDPLCADAGQRGGGARLARALPEERLDAVRLRGGRGAARALRPPGPALAQDGGGGDRRAAELQPRRRRARIAALDGAQGEAPGPRGRALRPPLRRPARDRRQLEEISREWLAERRLGEMGFSLGRFSQGASTTSTCSSPGARTACSRSRPGARTGPAARLCST